MDLENVFTAKADDDGLYRVRLEFVANPYLRQQFRRLLNDTCKNLNIECGLNEEELCFDLGFINQRDHDDVMAIVQPAILNAGQNHLEYIDRSLKSDGFEHQGLAARPEMIKATHKDLRTDAALKRERLGPYENGAALEAEPERDSDID